MQGIYKAQQDNRKQIQSAFEISLAELGMHRERNRHIVEGLSDVSAMERLARRQIEGKETSLRDCYITQELGFLKEELLHRLAVERAFHVSIVEFRTLEVASRHFLYIFEGEKSGRESLAYTRDAEIAEIFELFQYTSEHIRYFATATASLMEECSLKSREAIAMEEVEREMLKDAYHRSYSAVIAYQEAIEKLCCDEHTTRTMLSEGITAQRDALFQEFRYERLEVLQATKKKYEHQYSLIASEEKSRSNIIDSYQQVTDSLVNEYVRVRDSILVYLDYAAGVLVEKYDIVIREKEDILNSFFHKIERDIDVQWEEYRHNQQLIAERRALEQKHFEDAQTFLQAEELARSDCVGSENTAFRALANRFHADGAALAALLEKFAQEQLNLYNEWYSGACMTYDEQHAVIQQFAMRYVESVNFQCSETNERQQIASSEESSWDALMQLVMNSKRSLFAVSAMTELEAFESYERNAMSIAHMKSLSSLHSHFIAENASIMLHSLESNEHGDRIRINQEYDVEQQSFLEAHAQLKSRFSVDRIMDTMEYANAVEIIRGEMNTSELEGLSGSQILALAKMLESMRATEFDAFQQCEKAEKANRDTQTKVNTKLKVIKSLTEDVSDAKAAIIKHREAQKMRLHSTKNLKQQRKARSEMIKKRRELAEKQVHQAIEELEKTRDQVRDHLRGQKSSPMAKRGKMY